ncbi:MAG: hypothetical protein QOD75_2060 [Blastocatellia bacterium]|jgi:hypothetical protein|nr:hypothetical protein [Blastocatellia bacterium]
MPARKSTRKTATPKKTSPIRALYGPPIRDAIKRGNAAEMKKVAAEARKQLSEVKAALVALEKKIAGK